MEVSMKGIISIFLIILSINIIASEKVEIDKKEIKLSVFHYPPYMDKNLENNGLFCELILEAYKAVGIEVEFNFYPLRRSTQYVIEGRSLGQLGTIWNFPIEEKDNLYFVPIFYYKIVGFYLKKNYKTIEIKNLNELRKYRISVILGSSDEQVLKSNENLIVESVSNMEQLFKQVYLGRSDIAFAVELSGINTLKNYYPKEIKKWGITEDYIQKINAHVVFSKKYPSCVEYAEKLKLGLMLIKENGIFSKIFKKYYEDYYEKNDIYIDMLENIEEIINAN